MLFGMIVYFLITNEKFNHCFLIAYHFFHDDYSNQLFLTGTKQGQIGVTFLITVILLHCHYQMLR